ncbi:hypothetical protein Pla52o_27380 [Novipirellula galeiformis]|uniref:Uncharacterized protein n=1 Tax=Novipirellula galeiformis TaxID=2528004 RepID=A0A5C6CE80_9BACT|nr:hypothetical protein Pla52o_27380 [Novipirellula galeiformis]
MHGGAGKWQIGESQIALARPQEADRCGKRAVTGLVLAWNRATEHEMEDSS